MNDERRANAEVAGAILDGFWKRQGGHNEAIRAVTVTVGRRNLTTVRVYGKVAVGTDAGERADNTAP